MGKFMRYSFICMVAALAFGGCSNTPEEPQKPIIPPPPPPPPPEFVIDVKAEYALGEVWLDNPSWFILLLSDVKTEEGGRASDFVVTGEGTLVKFDVFADAQKGDPLSVGKYRYVADKDAERKAQTFYAEYIESKADGSLQPTQFSEAELSVALNGDKYTFELIGKTKDGKTLRYTYTGAVEFVVGGGGGNDDIFPRMDRNSEATFTFALAAYMGTTETGAGYYDIRLADYEFTSGVDPGYILVLPMFGSAEGGALSLAPGTYTVAKKYASAATYKNGDIQPGFIDMTTLQNKGASLVNTRMEGKLMQYYGVISGGSLTVAREGNTYTFDIHLVDENGFTIKGTYVGPLNIQDNSYHSTLTDDATAELTGAVCNIYYNGKFYSDAEATAWLVQITTGKTGADAIQLELLTHVRSFEEGLSEGMYGITSGYVPGHQVCLAGGTDGYDLFRSWFLHGLQGPVADDVAPLVSGSVSLSIINGEYTFTINGYDDAPIGHSVKGVWTGKPIYHDATKPARAATAPSVFSHRFHTVLPWK